MFDSEWSIENLYRFAWHHAHKHVPREYRPDMEDIVQDVVTELFIIRHYREQKTTAKRCRFLVWNAMRNYKPAGLGYKGSELLVDDFSDKHVPVVRQLSHEGKLAMWRLQNLWDEFTSIQKAAVVATVDGSKDAAEDAARMYGVKKDSVIQAKNVGAVFEAINNPRVFLAKRKMRDLNLRLRWAARKRKTRAA